MSLHGQLKASAALATARPIQTPEDVRAALDEATKKIHDDLAKAIVEERAANEERVKALATGQSVADIEAKLERIQEDIQSSIETLNEHSLQLQRSRIASPGAAGGRDVQNDARMFYAAAGVLRGSDELTAEQVAAYQDYERTFERNVRRASQQMGGHFCAEMEVGSDSNGGFLAPTTMLSRVQRRLFETSEVRAVAEVLNISTNDLEIPLDVDDATSGGWVAEKAARTETATPQVGKQKIETHEQFANPRITQTLLDDAAVDIIAWLSNKISDKLIRFENSGFVTGNGAGKPKGFMAYAADSVTTADASRDWGVLQHVVSGAAAGFPEDTSGADNFNALIDLIAELKPQYRANGRFGMSRRSEATVRKGRDANGQYLTSFTQVREGVFGFQIFGHPVSNFEDMPAFGSGLFPIAFGDFRAGYLIVDRMGVRILRDPYTAKPFVQFYTTKRVGGDVIDFDAIKLLKCST